MEDNYYCQVKLENLVLKKKVGGKGTELLHLNSLALRSSCVFLLTPVIYTAQTLASTPVPVVLNTHLI